MAKEALGLVETQGFVGAVEAADAMCKTAQVRLVRYEVTRGALVTVLVRGPVAEVEAAVAAGTHAAARIGRVFTTHVIPAPDAQLEQPIAGPATSRP
ncbi:MAG: BMC domain-containing protein [Candidatus Eisenbacteria bacterium]|uniref:BMC domain-containing protein n=1 Tax=Eiseniibacteriota bacterium TaxID=2212470 RepID=A0A538U9P9_UNCEI|nr:MAG: BMC domain-containing protein [Candidatus Eisenbacteria bacterium]